MTVPLHHDPMLVGISVLLAVFASYTALNLARRIRTSAQWMRRFWLMASAATLGGGIWSMHFVAMLAVQLPGTRTGYVGWLTALSLVLAVAFTGGGFAVMNRRPANLRWTMAAGLLMGAGVVAMHYVGMAALRLPALVRYDPAWVAASIVIAIIAATASLRLAATDRNAPGQVLAACFMGAAISGMHYAGMRAASIQPFTALPGDGPAGVGRFYLAAGIGFLTLVILLFALGAARVDEIFQALVRREARVALRLKIADVLRDDAHPEALDQVAALMGEHFGVSRTGYGQLDAASDQFEYDTCWTDGSVPPLLGNYPAAAFGVKIVKALHDGVTIVVDDLQEAEVSDEARTRETARQVDTRAILVVPFVRDGRLRTIVYLNDRKPRTWRRDEIAFMEELAERTRLVVERAAVERQLRALNAELEARVEARTAELRQAQEALLQSQKMEAIGQLASGIAHDFNNLLASVVGAFQLIGRRADDPERVRHFAEAGLEAAERGSKLTGQLLSFSRAQAITLQPVVVCDVIAGIADLLRRTLGSKIELEFDLNPNPVPVIGDPTQVEMMVLNLVINARDAMPDGGRLTIRTRVRTIRSDPELGDGEYVQLSVTDTGLGMDADTLRRAMEPFFTTKPVGKGTGLGLSQIYGSARKAGGTARIESTPGLGTTVHVLLARSPQAVAVQDRPSTGSSATPAAPLTILAVDDDDQFRELLQRMLEDAGHAVVTACNGPAALLALEQLRPDVVLLDYAMPGMTGAEVAAQVRRRWPELPIVFATGFADTAAIDRVVGPNGCSLRKPFRQEELLATLARLAPARPIPQAQP
ncbi:MAG: response regulator [Sphingomonadales bacterium]|nr:response regulator [Sphingomonadales bacterium]